MVYLLIGEDHVAKDAKIEEIKQNVDPSGKAALFDYEVLYGHKLDQDVLKKALISLPAIAAKRLVVVKESHRLSAAHQELITQTFQNKLAHVALILDFNGSDGTEGFIKKLKNSAQIIEFFSQQKLNVFDMTRAIERQKGNDALKILHSLLTNGEHPLQILGGLVWFWGKTRIKMSAARFEKGLLALQEADLNIKRSRLQSEYALELLIVKLCVQEVC